MTYPIHPFAGHAQDRFLLGECLQVIDGDPCQIVRFFTDHILRGIGRLHGKADIVMQVLRFATKARNIGIYYRLRIFLIRVVKIRKD